MGQAAARKNDLDQIRKRVSDVAAGAIEEQRKLTLQAQAEHRLLAGEMVQFSKDLAKAQEARAVDARRLGASYDRLAEQLENVSARSGEERTHRLQLADEQRAYVDREDRQTRKRLEFATSDAASERLILEVILSRFARMSFRQRLQWLFLGRQPSGPMPPDPITPTTPAERERFWQDIGRPLEGKDVV